MKNTEDKSLQNPTIKALRETFVELVQGLLLGGCFVILFFLIATCSSSAYSMSVHQKADELALVGYEFSNGAQSANRAFFVRNISMRSHVMAELERDAFERAGIRLNLSTNPFQLCHPHLVVNGKAPLKSNGAH